MSILQNIHGHESLLALNDDQRATLCQEIRDFLVENVSQTGGHLASNLGAVELSVAIETVFDTMHDRLVFDVGHQSYVHKLLTGRQADFAHLRQFGGIAGFPKPEESDADAFVAGHASSSVSIALGMARARTLMEQDYHVVALLGDGAATGGMIYEGLNDASDSREPMVIILNDNEMSIDKNVGGLSSHLSQIRAKEQYLGLKQKYRRIMGKTKLGRILYRFSKSVKDRIKRFVLPGTIFENMGLMYLGPVDGHDLPGLIVLLRTAKDLKMPVLVHVVTQKGRGYVPAEQNPSKFHGIGKFDPATGDILGKKKKTFSDSFGEVMVQLAAADKRLCAITAAMPGGTGLLDFKDAYPNRLFDVGIAEEHAVSMAGGLAKQGMIPVVALYSTFLQRAYDQIMQDVALQGLHVVFAIDRAGLVGEDGATHHGTFDVGFLRQIPGMLILAPASIAEQQDMLVWAVSEYDGPVAVRYPRGGNGAYVDSEWKKTMDLTSDVTFCIHRQGKDVLLVTYGTMIENTMSAAKMLADQGIEATVIRLMNLSCVQISRLCDIFNESGCVVVIEEVNSGSGIADTLAQQMPNSRVYAKNLGEDFATHGSVELLYKYYGLDEISIAKYVREVLGNEN